MIINLRVDNGEFAFIVGSSGAGKSSIIKLLLRETTATEGTVIVNGYNLNRLRNSQIPNSGGVSAWYSRISG